MELPQSLLYLGGPISGLTYGDCTSWRDYVQKKLPPHIIAISPMRAKQYLDDGKIITGSYEQTPLSSEKGITARDRFDVMRAHAVLFNFLGATAASIGSCIEVGWADAFRKPVIMAIEDEKNVHDYPMIRDIAGFRLKTLEEAINVAIALLSPVYVPPPTPQLSPAPAH